MERNFLVRKLLLEKKARRLLLFNRSIVTLGCRIFFLISLHQSMRLAPDSDPKQSWLRSRWIKKNLYWAYTGEIINSADMRTNLHSWISTTKIWFLALEELYKSFFIAVRINWMKICLIYIVFAIHVQSFSSFITPIHVQSFSSFITQVYAYSNYLSREKKIRIVLLAIFVESLNWKIFREDEGFVDSEMMLHENYG